MSFGNAGGNQNLLNILFGTIATVLAIAAIIVGFLQLRQYRRAGVTRDAEQCVLAYQDVRIL